MIWTVEELEIVRALYPSAPWPEIRSALRGRTEKGIAAAAKKIGIKRSRGPYEVKSKAKQESVARANAKRSAKRAAARKHEATAAKMAKRRRKAGQNGAEFLAAQARMREAQQKPCPSGTYRASNGVTLAKSARAELYNERG